MTPSDVFKNSKIIETIENYAIADRLDRALSHARDIQLSKPPRGIEDDQSFWNEILSNPDDQWNRLFSTYYCVLSEWVPRVPGLFWTKSSQRFRKFAEAAIDIRTDRGTEYHPPGKSGKVLGGIGTIRLPPDVAGYQLMTLTFSGNTSAGIPALISPDMLDRYQLKEGDVLNVQARWVRMSMEWCQRFQSVKDIPRGYLLVDNTAGVSKNDQGWPVEFHPFTIMEYESGNSKLFDYAYITAGSLDKTYRRDAQRFFEYYRTKNDRNGRYLLECDINNPLFDAVYSSPLELRTGPYANQINLITERLYSMQHDNDVINKLIDFIGVHYKTNDDLKTLATHLKIANQINLTGTPAHAAAEIVEYCAKNNMTDQLVERIAFMYPEILTIT